METENVQKLVDKHGTEAALLLLNQVGYLRWAEGKKIRDEDIDVERLASGWIDMLRGIR